MPSSPITHAAAEAASAVRNWHHGDVLGTLSMTEGYALAALFEQLHENEAAEHIIREVWTGEPADSRDPLPWVNAHGSRLSDDEHTTTPAAEGDERFHFAPRTTFEDQADVIAYRAARECADCGAYEGPLHTDNGTARCAVCRPNA